MSLSKMERCLCLTTQALSSIAPSKYWKRGSQLVRLLLESKAVEGNVLINTKRPSGAMWIVLETGVSTMHSLSSLLQRLHALLFHSFS